MADACPPVDLPAYHEVFRDDFNGASLHRGRWPVVYGGASSNGAFTWSAEDVAVWDGVLALGMTRGAAGWTAGGIRQDGPGTLHGLFQACARMEAGKGVGPAILLWPASNTWPGPEVDILEAPDADRSRAFLTIHRRGEDGRDAYEARGFALDVTRWHSYAVEWRPGLLRYFIDGVERFSTTQHVPREAGWLALQGHVASATENWYGGAPDGTTPARVRLLVDWVSIGIR